LTSPISTLAFTLLAKHDLLFVAVQWDRNYPLIPKAMDTDPNLDVVRRWSLSVLAVASFLENRKCTMLECLRF
jgi:hypothetical protein